MIIIETKFGTFKTFMELFVFLDKNKIDSVDLVATIEFGVMQQKLTINQVRNLSDIEARNFEANFL